MPPASRRPVPCWHRRSHLRAFLGEPGNERGARLRASADVKHPAFAFGSDGERYFLASVVQRCDQAGCLRNTLWRQHGADPVANGHLQRQIGKLFVFRIEHLAVNIDEQDRPLARIRKGQPRSRPIGNQAIGVEELGSLRLARGQNEIRSTLKPVAQFSEAFPGQRLGIPVRLDDDLMSRFSDLRYFVNRTRGSRDIRQI